MSNRDTRHRKFAHPLFGSSLSNLINLLRHNGPPGKAHGIQTLAALITAAARTPLSLLEELWYGHTLNQLDMPPPVFIIGHWRSGTTHLANLICQSPQFGTVTPVASGLPHNLLMLGKWLKPWLEKKIPSDRLIDSVAVTPSSPQEDEFGLANMVTTSFLHALYFPGNFDKNWNHGIFHHYWSTNQMEHWEKAHSRYLRKVFLDQGRRPIVVRNPVYTGCIPLLRSIWPGAKFIHIYRNPYEVFPSMKNYFQKLFPALALQEYEQLDIEGVILSTFQKLMKTVIHDKQQLSDDEFMEIPYEELRKTPLSVIESVYNQLQLPEFEVSRPYFENYLDGIRGYKRNEYQQDASEVDLIKARWGEIIEHYGY